MKELTNELKNLLDQAIQNGEIAGANVLIMKDGKELLYTETGYANIEEGRSFKRDTILRLYSMTKPVTATAAMILMERGLLELSRPVGDILEAFQNMEVWENGKKVFGRE